MGIIISPQDETKKLYPWEQSEEDWVSTAKKDFFVTLKKVFAEFGIQDISQELQFLGIGIGGPELVNEIWHWLQGFRVIEEEQQQFETAEVPLYLFDSPAIEKAKTTVTKTECKGATADWLIKVFGNGFGSDFTVSIKQSSQFTSSNGHRKLVFAPLRVRIIRAALYRGKELKKYFLRTELAESEERDADGVRSLDEVEWANLSADGQPVERFDLSGDKSNDIATYKRSYSLSGNFITSLGFKAFDLESTVSAKVSTEQSVEVILALPAGNFYQLRSPSMVSGFFFEHE